MLMFLSLLCGIELIIRKRGPKMKIKIKDIKKIVEGVVKEALSERSDEERFPPSMFGRYNSTMTKMMEDYDIHAATREHGREMKKLSNALQDALDSGGAVKAMEISKQMEELNRQLEQQIESIIRSNDADARPMEEQMVDPDQVASKPPAGAPAAAPETAQPAVKQKADVDVVLKYIQRINNVVEYAQLLNAVLKHVPGGDKPKHKKAVKQVFAAFGVSSSAVKKVAGE
jgi:hypothetical protein